MILCIGTTPAVQRTMVFGPLMIGEVNRAAETYDTPAGKSVNVAKVLAALGETVMASGFVGGPRGEFLRRRLDALGIAHDFVTVEPETRLCITLVDRVNHTHTELVEESAAVRPAAWEELLAKLPLLMARATVVILSGTLPPGAPADFYRTCIEHAHKAQLPTVLDAKGEPLRQALAARPMVVKPNLAELAATYGFDPASAQELRATMRKLIDAGAQWAIITQGSRGALATDGRGFWRLTGPQVQAVNTIGSGDAFAAGLAAGIARGQTVLEAARLGMACGAANALTLLSADVRPEDVQRLMPEVRVIEDRG